MLPQWKSTGLSFWLKAWKPSVIEGITFILQEMNGSDYYQLDIGAEKNEKVILYYVGDNGIKIIIIVVVLVRVVLVVVMLVCIIFAQDYIFVHN